MTDPIPTYFFSAVVVRDGARFVLVHELDGTWGLPGGRLEAGETFVDAAHREAHEEAGIEIELEGLLGFEHSPMDGWSRMGAAFVARPVDHAAALKSVPDDQTQGASWYALDDLERIPLRSARVSRLVRRAFEDGVLVPLDRVESALDQ